MHNFVKLFLVLFGLGADVITVTTGTVGNAGNVAADLQTFFAAQLLNVAEFNTILDQFGDRVDIPSNSSKTVHFVRQEKQTVAATPTQLTEGIAPDAEGITLNQFEAVVEQYGRVVRLSDLAELTAKHPIVQSTIRILGLAAAETYDQLVYNVLDAASNVYRPNNKGADTSLIGSDRLGYVDLVNICALLMDQGAMPFEGGDYVLVQPPQVYGALLNDPDFKAANQFQAPDKIWRGEAGVLGNFRLIRSNSPAFAVTTQAGAGQSSKVYSSFALGRSAYQISNLQNLQFYQVGPGGHTDPLEQSRKMGFKFAFKTLITNQNWIRRVRSSGLNSVTNP